MSYGESLSALTFTFAHRERDRVQECKKEIVK